MTGLGLIYKERAEIAGGGGDFQAEEENLMLAAGFFRKAVTQLGGAPDVGAELGALATAAGFEEIQFRPLPVRMDARMRDPVQRREFVDYWGTLALSGAGQLLTRGLVSPALVDAMQLELTTLAENPVAIYDYSARQVEARKPL